MMRRFSTYVTSFMLLLGGATAARSMSAVEVDAYSGRDGRGEALRALGNSEPLKLYAHVFNGRAPFVLVPGLIDCDARYHLPSVITFVIMPEAEYREGVSYSSEQLTIALPARRFAEAYNKAIFAARPNEVRKACPKATLAN